ncbi:HesA/MoeB/ThiF family protein [Desulfonatronovibrio hydrogenovorans]|uniref:HesA/MoeB/ThiF family protein n=1 Tax=Desulfonatronovibrio hydrogenovorans TaxID=53245 RepID=UPI0013765BEB|nr:ThiF family adenylyltransferase [Desulfonatronovibrio hydrogenovorans]
MPDHNFIRRLKEKSLSSPEYPFRFISGSDLARLASDHHLSLCSAQSICLNNRINLKRYLRNHSVLSLEEQSLLAGSRVLMVGLGGLGGYVLEILARTGIGSFILADGDLFEESNLNRQILGTTRSLGHSKAEAAHERLGHINPFCESRIIPDFVSEDTLPGLLSQVDLVLDALGGISFRPVLLRQASLARIPLVTGFVAGTTGLTSTVLPQGKSPEAFWQGRDDQGAEITLGNMATIVSLTASIQAQEAIRILTGKKPCLSDKVLLADLETLTFDLLEL